MTVQEVKCKEIQFEIELSILIDDFNKETGCKVDSINIEYVISDEKDIMVVNSVTLKTII